MCVSKIFAFIVIVQFMIFFPRTVEELPSKQSLGSVGVSSLTIFDTDKFEYESSIISQKNSDAQNAKNVLTDYVNDFQQILAKCRKLFFCKSMGKTCKEKQLFSMNITVCILYFY